MITSGLIRVVMLLFIIIMLLEKTKKNILVNEDKTQITAKLGSSKL